MSEKPNNDPIAERRYSIAAIVRSFAWPIVVLIAMYHFSGTVSSLVRSSQKISVAGFAVEKFANNATLSNKQLATIGELSSEDILYFFNRYESDGKFCTPKKFWTPRDKMLIEAGLLVAGNGACGEDNADFIELSPDGARLRSAIGEIVAEALSQAINRKE
jgi:hypothetical protein